MTNSDFESSVFNAIERSQILTLLEAKKIEKDRHFLIEKDRDFPSLISG